MPNTKSAAKAMRQSLRRRQHNLKIKDKFKSEIKKVKKLIAKGQRTEAVKALTTVMSALDKAAKTGVIHKNTASRRKSRLAKAVGKIKTPT